MCGIVGIVGASPVNQSIYDALTVLQHRGQDAAGIVTIESNRFRLRKANGLVRDVFAAKHMQRYKGMLALGMLDTQQQGALVLLKLNRFMLTRHLELPWLTTVT